jgi:hypothetical protein
MTFIDFEVTRLKVKGHRGLDFKSLSYPITGDSFDPLSLYLA